MKKYDMIVIGLGPAGMAASIMGSAMGFKVCAIERHQIGGECTNVGCLPSKGILKFAATNPTCPTALSEVRERVRAAREEQLEPMFKKIHTIKGVASFVNENTILIDGEKIVAKKIFVAVGTRPMVPPIPGLSDIDYLTNDNIFSLDKAPASMVILGGGMIATEMALAFHRLGCKCTIVQNDAHLIPSGEKEAAELLEKKYKEYGIDIHNNEKIISVNKEEGLVVLKTESGKEVRAERILVAAGRKQDFSDLKLENAGVEYTKRGITVDPYLRTNKKHIFAVGDCNGHYLLSPAAMHQSMIALMNTFIPWPFKKDFRKYPVPWTAFTDPEVSHVGMGEKELNTKGISYIVTQLPYSEYGGATVQGACTGYIKVYSSAMGKIYGVSIVGQNSGEMINEWSLAIQQKLRLFDVMMTMHSFPTIGFLSKRAGEMWMMKTVKKPWVQKLLSWMR